MVNDEVLNKARFLYQLGIEAYRTVSEFNKQTDQKIIGTVTATTALTPILLGVFYYLFSRSDISTRAFPPLFVLSFIVGIILFTIVVFYGFFSYRAREFKMLRVDSVIDEAKNSSLVDITKIAAVNIVDTSNHNIEVVLDKAHDLSRLLLILSLGLSSFVVAFVALVFL
jgi:hypothetical protein